MLSKRQYYDSQHYHDKVKTKFDYIHNFYNLQRSVFLLN